MNGMLSDQQLSEFKYDGFLFPIEIMSEAEAGDHVQRLATLEAEHGPMHYRNKPYLICTSAYELGTHKTLLDAVESVLGPDILLWDCAYVIKEPRSEKFVSWHQDLTYWGLEMDSDDDLLSAWVALTPATVANGCMRFVRSSHRGGTFSHVNTRAEENILHHGQTIEDDFDDEEIVHIVLRPGEVSFHHGWAVHSSNPNITDGRRIGIVFNYTKSSVRQVVGDDDTATLVRGRDDYRNFGAEPRCQSDFAPDNVAFQADIERRRREVYDNAT